MDSTLVDVNASFVGGRAEVYLSTSEAGAPLARRDVQLGATCPKGEVLPASEHSEWRRSTSSSAAPTYNTRITTQVDRLKVLNGLIRALRDNL